MLVCPELSCPDKQRVLARLGGEGQVTATLSTALLTSAGQVTSEVVKPARQSCSGHVRLLYTLALASLGTVPHGTAGQRRIATIWPGFITLQFV